MTWYPNYRYNRFLVLCWRKVRFAHLPSPKYYILFFWFWYFEAVRFASRIFLHQSTTSYFFYFWYFEGGGYSPLSKWHVIWMTEILNWVLCWRKVRFAHLPSPKYCILFSYVGTLMQEDLRSKSDCIKVLHSIFWFLVLWSSQICFANPPASKYYILFFDNCYFEAVRFASQIFLHQSTTSYFLIWYFTL